MNITILGAGNAGCTVAADLSLKGHKVTLCKTSYKLHNENFKVIEQVSSIKLEKGRESYNAQIYCVTTSLEKAITVDTELIIVYIQTNYHEQLIKKIEPYLFDNQMILFEPGYLSTAYLIKYTKKQVISIEAESSPIDCRIIEPGVCTILFKNIRNPIAVYPKNKTEYVLNKLDSLEYHFSPLESVVEAALHNPNLIVHTAGAIMSVPRIEYTSGEYWMYKEVFTESVWNMVEKLDSEKMAVLKKLSLKPLPYVEACKERNFNDEDLDAKEAFFDYAYNYAPKGPLTADSRYITEDVSQGLCLLESIGKFLNIGTPITTSLIEISSALLKRDLRMEGRTIERLGWNNIQKIIEDQ